MTGGLHLLRWDLFHIQTAINHRRTVRHLYSVLLTFLISAAFSRHPRLLSWVGLWWTLLLSSRTQKYREGIRMQLLPTSPAAVLTFYITINLNSFGWC